MVSERRCDLKKVFGLLAVMAVLLLSVGVICDTGSSPVMSVGGAGSGLRVTEVDGSPDVFNARQLKFPNGTLSNLSGAVTFTPSLSPSFTSVTVANGSSGGLFGLNGSTPFNLISNTGVDVNIGDVGAVGGNVTVSSTDSFNVFIEGVEGVFSVTGSVVQCGLPLELEGVAFANLPAVSSGKLVYCSDCTKTTPCAGSGTGAIAKRLAGAWDCD